jgi:hypothetical protein
MYKNAFFFIKKSFLSLNDLRGITNCDAFSAAPSTMNENVKKHELSFSIYFFRSMGSSLSMSHSCLSQQRDSYSHYMFHHDPLSSLSSYGRTCANSQNSHMAAYGSTIGSGSGSHGENDFYHKKLRQGLGKASSSIGYVKSI